MDQGGFGKKEGTVQLSQGGRMLHKASICLLLFFLFLLNPLSQAHAGETEPTQTVIVTGVGGDPDLALSNAMQNAIQKVGASFLSRDSKVDIEALLSDENLSHSGDFVQEMNVVSTSQSEGMVKVRLQAVVAASLLKRKIEELLSLTHPQ